MLTLSANTIKTSCSLLLAAVLLPACTSTQTQLPVELPHTPPPVLETVPTEVATTQPLLVEEIILDSASNELSRQQRLDDSLLVGGSYPDQIALLLPLTSPLGRAAEAFQSGFMDALNESPVRSSVRIYDTGSEHDLAALYYLSAINDGSQFVVGPLGKQAVDGLLAQQELSQPTLLIGQVPAGNVIGNAWGISLSPEDEARAAARKALSEGLFHAAIIHRNNEWGHRVATAFQETYETEGGIVVGNSRFQPGAKDSANAIKSLLALNESEARHKIMSGLLGKKLKFSSRRRNDLDFVFLAGNSQEARRVVPQLKFFRAHNLPVYATSAVFSGKVDPVSDADLIGLSFPDIPWMLSGLDGSPIESKATLTDLAQTTNSGSNEGNLSFDTFQKPANAANSLDTASNAPIDGLAESADMGAIETGAIVETPSLRLEARQLPYGGSGLDRLYALGQTAFGVIPQIASLTADPSLSYSSDSMTVQIDDGGNLVRSFAWAHYTAKGIEVEQAYTPVIDSNFDRLPVSMPIQTPTMQPMNTTLPN